MRGSYPSNGAHPAPPHVPIHTCNGLLYLGSTCPFVHSLPGSRPQVTSSAPRHIIPLIFVFASMLRGIAFTLPFRIATLHNIPFPHDLPTTLVPRIELM